MGVRLSGSASFVRRLLPRMMLIAGSLFAHSVLAAPPSIGGGPINIAIPPVGGSVTVNLRQIGVLSGSAPLRIDSAQMLINGQTSAVLVAAVERSSPGAVCVTIRNADFSPANNPTLSLRVAVSNLNDQSAGPTGIAVTNSAGTTPNLSTCGDPNTRPIANAGANRTVADTDGVAGETVLLDGSGSSDANPGTVLTYSWTRAGVALGRPSTNPTLSVPLPNGENTVELTVTDDSGDSQTNSASARAIITVNAPQPPTVNAGADRTVADTNNAPGEMVTLTATANDPDGQIQSYLWTRGSAQIGTGATIQAALLDGANDITVTVTDNSGLTATDSVRITVTAPQPQAPTVDAGADRTIADTDNAPNESVTLTATGSDPDGQIQSFTWRLNGTVLGTGATIQATLPDGANDVSVTVVDNSNLTATDTVRITVTAPQPRAPTVNAGADRTIADTNNAPNENVTLTAAANDPDGTIQSYSWRLGNAVLGTTATIQTTLPDGANDVTVTVTDNSGLTASDTVRITVAPAPRAPTVNAGADRTIADTNGAAGEPVTLTATASDPDGTVQSIVWQLGQTSLGSGATIQANLPDGANDVVVTVTDNSGLTATDTVRITVTAPPRVPTVNAGVDRVIADTDGQPGEAVTLTATASDPDGTIQSYRWTRGEALIGSGATIQVPLPDGVNDITVTVTDNSELTASDSVQITIGATQTPTVNAGEDRLVADTNGQPGETVTLTATASDPDGTIQSYAWRRGETVIGTTASIQTPLPDGVSDLSVTVTDNTGLAATDSIRVTVTAAAAPVANAGSDQVLADTDGQPGELVNLSGSGTARHRQHRQCRQRYRADHSERRCAPHGKCRCRSVAPRYRRSAWRTGESVGQRYGCRWQRCPIRMVPRRNFVGDRRDPPGASAGRCELGDAACHRQRR